jgi:hypothetical protein
MKEKPLPTNENQNENCCLSRRPGPWLSIVA